MIKSAKGIIATIDGVENYSIFSLLIFVMLFAIVMVFVFGKSKAYYDKMGSMPFSENLKK